MSASIANNAAVDTTPTKANAQRTENDAPNTPEPVQKSQWDTSDASILAQVRSQQMAPTPQQQQSQEQKAATKQMPPTTPMLNSRTRVAAQTPGGAALVFGTPAKFHASPAGRKSAAAIAASAKKPVAPRTAPRKQRGNGVRERLTKTAVKAAKPKPEAMSPAPHPNPMRPFAMTPPAASNQAQSDAPFTPEDQSAAAMRAGSVAAAIANDSDELIADDEVNTPYINARLQAALARHADTTVTPRADETPMAKKFNGTRAQLLEKLAELDRELQLTRDRHAALIESVGEGNALSIVDGKAVAKERAAMSAEVDALQREIVSLKQQLAAKDDVITAAHNEVRARDAEIGRLNDSNKGLEDVTAGFERQCNDKEKTINTLRDEIKEQAARIEKLLEQAKHDMKVRRRLNNEIQELKGNIRVYCRVRPLMKTEKQEQTHKIAFPNDEEIRVTTVERSNVGGQDKRRDWNFTFNRTFATKSSQNEIFDEIGGLVQSALDGFNVCVFAYGQTGAGKTYTMEGPNVSDMDDWSKGVIPRAVEQIFAYAAQQRELAWSYEIECSFLEIYLDECYDLLATTSGTERSASRDKLDLRQQRDGSVEIAGLTVASVDRPELVYDLLQRAAMHRATASTKKNDRSSRSHSVFQMKLSGTNLETGNTTTGCLNLVDLAGSERVAKSGATGEQLNEAKAINKSLSTLGDVIRAVAEGSAHVPYRNSKLTRLLEPYLGGNSKTLMFVNVSPCSRDMSETISSLRFAEQVNSCSLGKLTKNNR